MRGRTDLWLYICHVDSIILEIKIDGHCFLHPLDGDGLIVVASLQRDAVDVGLGREEEEGLRHNADCAIADQFQPHGTGTDGSFGWWAVQAQVTATIVVVGAWVRTCQYKKKIFIDLLHKNRSRFWCLVRQNTPPPPMCLALLKSHHNVTVSI